MANEEKTPFLEDVENDKLPEPAVFSRGGKVLAISLLLNSVLLILVLLLGGTLFVSANHKRPVVHGEVHEHLSEPYCKTFQLQRKSEGFKFANVLKHLPMVSLNTSTDL